MTLRDAFVQGMGRAAQTVCVVTTGGVEGRAGLTISTMASVSADGPYPTLMICVHHTSQAAPRILANGGFCVNMLRADQSRIADVFAGRFAAEYPDKFSVAEWAPMPLGSARLSDPLVAFECRLSQHSRIGTHFVFVGEVQNVHPGTPGLPLIYANRSYGTPAPLAAPSERLAIASMPGLGALILPDLLVQAGAFGVDLTEAGQPEALLALHAGAVDLALIIDHDLPGGLTTKTIAHLHPVAVLREDHRLASHSALTLQDLASEALIIPQPAEAVLAGTGLASKPAFRVGSPEMMRALVLASAGIGLMLLPALQPRTLNAGLATLPLQTGAPPLRLILAHRSTGAPAAQAQRLYDLAPTLSPPPA